MTNQEIADRLVELCRKGDFETCYKELYSPNVKSIEMKGAPNEEVTGLEGIAEKGKMWNDMVEKFHGSEIGDPIVAGNHFAIPWTLELTYKGAPAPSKMHEICVYEITDGKITKEQFFYEPDN